MTTTTTNFSFFLLVASFFLTLSWETASAFLFKPLAMSPATSRQRIYATQDIGRPHTFLDEQDDDDDDDDYNGDAGLTIKFLEEDDYDDEEDEEGEEEVKPKAMSPGRQRWENLNPKIKQRLIEKGQAKAIANKKKREPIRARKRRMMMYFKEKQREKKRASRIERPLNFDERIPLTAFFPGMEVRGVVISLTNFGAYIDVGSECDGLLHVSQITRDFFVEHPRQVLSPGDEITVKVRRVAPELKKMQLTMLEAETEEEEEYSAEDRIPLSDIEIDDELWGELNRVTDFGAYIEVGAEVDGFLHFMDHPLWTDGMHPSEFMQKGERVRVWVADVDNEQRRIRLTANRPQHLPGPRREF